MPKERGKEGRKIKTSLILPEDLWIRLRVAAVEDRTEMSTIIARLVEAYLREREQRKERRGHD